MSGKAKIGASIALDGERDFRQAISEINKSISVLNSEMNKVSASFDDNKGSAEALTATYDVLGRKELTQKEKVEALEKALQASAEQYGESSNKTKEWQIQLNNAQAALIKTQNEVNKTTKKINELGNEEEEATKKGSMLSTIFKAGFFANIAANALSSVVQTIKQLGSEAFATADELIRLSAETRLSIERLQELKYIGDDTGVSVDKISSALSLLIRNMNSAKNESGKAYDAFSALGVEFRDNITGNLLDSNSVFNNVIDALGRMTNETERDAAAQALLGRSAADLNPIISAGSEALNKLAADAHKAGAIMSDDAVVALDYFGDQMSHLWQIVVTKTGESLAAVEKSILGYTQAGQAAIENLDSLEDKLAEIQSAYDAAAMSAKISISEQIGLWKDMSSTVTKDFTDINNAINSQITYLQDYNTNLFNLSQRRVAGVDQLVQSLSDGSKESAAILAGLAAASDSELQTLIGNLSEVQDRSANLSRQIGQIKTDTNEQLNALYGGYKKTASEQLDASNAAAVAGRKTMQGYLNGIGELKPAVLEAFKNIALDAGFLYPKYENNSTRSDQPASGSSYQSSKSSLPNSASYQFTLPISLTMDNREVARQQVNFNVEQGNIRGTNLIK